MRWLRRLFPRACARIAQVEIPAEGHARVVELELGPLGRREIVLCRVAGALHALDRDCPHEHGQIAGGPLADGRYAQCPLHGYKFDPATGRAVGIACVPAQVYRVRERGGFAEILA